MGTKLAGVVFVQLLETVGNSTCGRALCRSIEALKELCGDTTLKNVVIMIRHRDTDKPKEEQRLISDLSPKGCFYPAIEQGAQVYHCNEASNPDLGALRIILRGRPVIPKVQQEPINEGSGPERMVPATEPSKEIPKLAERQDSDVKELEGSMQEVVNKKVEELLRELEEQKRRAREEADMFKKQIAEMQSKEEIVRKEMVREHRQELEEQERRAQEEADGLRNHNAELQSKPEEGRHASGKPSTTYGFPPVSASSRVFLVGFLTHLASQRVYPSTDLPPNSPISSMTHFTGRNMNNGCKTFRNMTWPGLSTIWTRHVTISPFLTRCSSCSVGS